MKKGIRINNSLFILFSIIYLLFLNACSKQTASSTKTINHTTSIEKDTAGYNIIVKDGHSSIISFKAYKPEYIHSSYLDENYCILAYAIEPKGKRLRGLMVAAAYKSKQDKWIIDYRRHEIAPDIFGLSTVSITSFQILDGNNFVLSTKQEGIFTDRETKKFTNGIKNSTNKYTLTPNGIAVNGTIQLFNYKRNSKYKDSPRPYPRGALIKGLFHNPEI